MALEIATPGTAVQPRDTAQVLGCRIDRLTMAETLDRCEQAVLGRRPMQHMAINAAKLVNMQTDPELREVIDQSELVTADGQAVVWASRLLDDPLPERVAGVDLMHNLFALAAVRGYSVYILGAKQEVLETAVANLREQHPRLRFAGYRNGYFGADEWHAIAEEIRQARPDMLFVAISSPTKELFLGRHREQMDVPFVMGVGGGIDIVANLTRRAPALWQRLGLEWLYRLLQEPRRMAKRYVTTNTRFIGAVGRQWLRARLLPTPAALPPVGQMQFRHKARMAIEIAGAYLVLRPHLQANDVRAMVSEARRVHPRRPLTRDPHPQETARRLGSMVQQVLSAFPADDRCLIQSLVLVRLLTQRGIDGSIVIGARSDGGFAAHAWVEYEGKPVLPPQCFERLVTL
jgi:N-acetylglucosaminyldiphosphoundecaprenol N-acetyl-beta-D-mannosaminyltransferase